MSDLTTTKQERDELANLLRRRAKLAKREAERLAAARLAEFERALAAEYRVDDESVWGEAALAAYSAVNEANERVRARCRELGIRDEFAPNIASKWWAFGGRSSAQARIKELRKLAKRRIDADLRAAKVEIEHRSLDIQTDLVARGLTSDEARRFLDRMPLVLELLAPLSVAEIEAADGRRSSGEPPS